MARALADFSIAAENAHTTFFYFAGHGVELDGQNFLLPKDAQLDHVRRIYYETIKLSDVRHATERASHLSLIVLDACRDNPFPITMRGLNAARSIRLGLAPIEVSGNNGVAYAVKAGYSAGDGKRGGHSPYTTALLEHFEQPNLDVRLMFGAIRDRVCELTSGSQVPAFYSDFGGQLLYLSTYHSRLALVQSPSTLDKASGEIHGSTHDRAGLLSDVSDCQQRGY